MHRYSVLSWHVDLLAAGLERIVDSRRRSRVVHRDSVLFGHVDLLLRPKSLTAVSNKCTKAIHSKRSALETFKGRHGSFVPVFFRIWTLSSSSHFRSWRHDAHTGGGAPCDSSARSNAARVRSKSRPRSTWKKPPTLPRVFLLEAVSISKGCRVTGKLTKTRQ